MTINNQFSQAVLAWYEQYGRKNLPWQQHINPYRVWVSEIMLQQTQVKTVIPYFERFMQRFPDVQTLAQAELDDVLHHWTGLGYYARGRNLHACAKQVVADYQGEFPTTIEQLSALPGIGRSTACAIAAISMGQATAILDGNVKRVLTRFFAVTGHPSERKVELLLWDKAQQLMPKTQTREYTQAMMDLGATICTRTKPSCGLCPLAVQCLGLKTGNPIQFPTPKAKKEKPIKHSILLMLQTPAGEYLLEQRPNSGIWGGLWSFPEANTEQEANQLISKLALGAAYHCELLPSFRHTFSHYHLDIQPLLVRLKQTPSQIAENGNVTWYNPQQPQSLGLAAPVKKLLEQHKGTA